MSDGSVKLGDGINSETEVKDGSNLLGKSVVDDLSEKNYFQNPCTISVNIQRGLYIRQGRQLPRVPDP